jgi:CTP:phosphocholine cytidylyltransferase-like protein
MSVVKRNAIIMAAGLSTRFVPLSLEKPKALLKVKNEILIERQIMQLMEAGISNIILVVGYLKEQFHYLQDKFDITIVENPYYLKRNNHSSLYVAREHLGNSFICSGDNYFHENVFMEQSDVPYYASVYTKGCTDEWCFTVDKEWKITDVMVGGKDAWIMKGHAFFTDEFSGQMKPLLIKAMENPDDRSKFWENLYMENIDEMAMFVKRYEDGVIEEFDNLEELRKFDKTYSNNTECGLLEKIAGKLGCPERDLLDFEPLKLEEKVFGFTFRMQGKFYRYELGKGLV